MITKKKIRKLEERIDELEDDLAYWCAKMHHALVDLDALRDKMHAKDEERPK